MYYCDYDDETICLPDIVECTNLNNSDHYFSELYRNVFVRDFIDSNPRFNNKPVHIRKEPMNGCWEHGFIHMTHNTYSHKSADLNDRFPDFRRSERLSWVKYIINDYLRSTQNNCPRSIYWEELYRGYVRPHLMVYDDDYDAAFLVVLEERKNEYFIITSFYLEKPWQIEKRERKYEQYQKQKTPLT